MINDAKTFFVLFVTLIVSIYYFRLLLKKKCYFLLFGYTYFSLSFLLGVLSHLLFKFIFDTFPYTEFYYSSLFGWFLGFLVFSVCLPYLSERMISVATPIVKIQITDSRLASGFLVSLLFLVISCWVFFKAGYIPLLSENIDESRSDLKGVGVMANFIFLINIVYLHNIFIFVNSKGIRKTLSFIFLVFSILILLGFAMRNYLIVSIITFFFYSYTRTGLNLSTRKLVLIGFLVVVFLLFFGMFRSGQSSQASILLMTTRFFSSVFSEFREWPDIFALKLEPDFISVFKSFNSIIPSSVFDCFGVSKEEYIFSSGMYFKQLLGREWQGEQLGLRTSLYGEFYLSFGYSAFILLPLFLVLALNFIISISNKVKNEFLYLVCMFLILVVFIGFSSELSTLVFKISLVILYIALYVFLNSALTLFRKIIN